MRPPPSFETPASRAPQDEGGSCDPVNNRAKTGRSLDCPVSTDHRAKNRTITGKEQGNSPRQGEGFTATRGASRIGTRGGVVATRRRCPRRRHARFAFELLQPFLEIRRRERAHVDLNELDAPRALAA